MAEVSERTVLRYTEGDPAPACPVCGKTVTSWSSEPETIWTLKKGYQGMVGLPVGPEFGDLRTVRQHIYLQPCGHEVDTVELTRRPKAADPLARFKVGDDYNGDKDLEHDCGWSHTWSWRDAVTLSTIVDKASAHAAECDQK